MKVVLFCQNAYSFGIMEPLKKVLEDKGHTYIWYITAKLKALFPSTDDPVTSSIQDLIHFKSDAIICPGNEVPHYLNGVKVQIFHGLAGEKKGHFRIRGYFDLYLTQGPYFTDGFNKLRQKHRNFEVVETGWSKLDVYAFAKADSQKEKKAILEKHNAQKILLYAPTFSPSLTSAQEFREEIKKLASNTDYVIHIKFHDLMSADHINYYKKLAIDYPNVCFIEDRDIIKQLVLADLLISDTSSVIYEFLLLDKPVVTLNNIGSNIQWNNITQAEELTQAVASDVSLDAFAPQRSSVIAQYHPYSDGQSSQRMLDAIEEYIARQGVPKKRKLPLLRRYKINKIFDKNS